MRYPRTIAVRRSWHPLLLIAAIHLVAAISFVSLLPAAGWVVGGLLVLGGSATHALARVRRDALARIELGDDGLLYLPDEEGEGYGLSARPTDFGWARWLQWREEGGRGRAVMLWRAQCSGEDWRALGLWLRHKAVLPGAELSDADAARSGGRARG